VQGVYGSSLPRLALEPPLGPSGRFSCDAALDRGDDRSACTNWIVQSGKEL